MAARFEDEDNYVRQAAMKALSNRSDCHVDLLKAVAARLGDEDNYVRQAAIDALSNRLDWSEGQIGRAHV